MKIIFRESGQYRKKKYWHLYFLLLSGVLPSMLLAQTSSQGFFLDNWSPKSIEILAFDSAAQTSQSANVSVTVKADSILSKISKYVYGHNAACWGGKLDQNTQVVKDIKNLAPNIIRWPGGSMSNEYMWKAVDKNSCPKDLPPDFGYQDLLYGSNNSSWTMSIDNYYSLLSKTTSTGIITVNYSYARYGTSADPVLAAAKYAADWVRYDNGRTRYWEIGNENFGSWEKGYTIDQTLNKDGQPKTISGELYGKHARVFMEEMRKAAKEVGNDIKIGVVAMDSYVTYDVVQRDWNQGMMKEAGNLADFVIVHNYHTPYQENSTVATILNSATKSKDMMQYINSGLKTYANHDPLPIALTEWNIFAIGSAQQVSFINGMHAALVLGEAMKNQYGATNRWDFMNGWDDGNSHGLFADGEPGITRYTPRAPFFYMYYFQKFFGDRLVHSTVTGSSDVVCYSSRFSSGQTGLVLLNKGTSAQVVNIKVNNFQSGSRYYYYLLTGGTDNGDFSRKVYVNGKTSTLDGGGPADYATLKPYGTTINGDIVLSLPKRATLFVVVEQKKIQQAQTIQLDPIPSKVFGDADFNISTSASSGLPVVITSSDPQVATIIQGKIHISAAGSCNIIASQPGNTDYLPATSVSQSLMIQKAAQTITFPVLTAKKTGDPDFSPGALASSGMVCSYSSSNPDVAVIVGNLIQIKGAGKTTITARQEGNGNYQAAADVSQELTVTVPTGIQTPFVADDFQMFPNPANSFLTIKRNSAIGNLSVLNAQGSVVYRNTVSVPEFTIPVNQFGGPGIYFVKVCSLVKKIFIVP
jgi:hypothetical protein